MGHRNRYRDGKDRTRKFRDTVFARDGYACVWCGRTRNLEIDHIIPMSTGGQNILENLQTLCFTCNHVKGNLIMSKEEGLAAIAKRKRQLDHKNLMLDIYGSPARESNTIRRLLREIRSGRQPDEPIFIEDVEWQL